MKDKLPQKISDFFDRLALKYTKSYTFKYLVKLIKFSLQLLFIICGPLIEGLETIFERASERIFSPFVDYKEYFSYSLGSEKIFRHDYQLFGRNDEIQKLIDFVKSDKKIAVLIGRGGIGKSKILYEFAKRKDVKKLKWRVIFLKENIDFDNKVLKQIPSGNIIIILEDAHRYEDLCKLLYIFRDEKLQRLIGRIKLIISTRPSGVDIINIHLSRVIDADKISRIGPIGQLDINETKKIIQNIVGNNKLLIDYLTNLSKDCPLVAVVGSRLVVKNRINPYNITNEEQFQRMVLDKFKEELEGKDLKDDISEKLLNYISVLAPINLEDKFIHEKLLEILKIETDEFIKRIEKLEQRGLLLKRGRQIRIIPDVLSDYILYEACIASGYITTFADKVFKEFRKYYLKNVLKNLGEVDWKINQTGQRVNLLGDIWEKIKKDFINSNNYSKTSLLNEIESVAFYQPSYVLDVIKIAIEKPSTKEPEKEYAKLYRRWNHKDVLREIPKLLKNVAYHLEYVKECFKILWELGKNDQRELNPYPEHPIRILQGMASYEYKKPVTYNKKVIECIENLLKEPDIHNYRWSLLDILDVFFSKEGEYIESEGSKIHWSSFPLNYKAIKPIREKALNMLKNCFNSSKPPKVISRSLRSLIEAIRYQMPKFGRVISDEEEKQYLEEQIKILDIIEEGVKKIKSYPINIEIKRELNWYKENGRHEEFKNKVAEVLDSIEENYEFRLYRAASYKVTDYWRDNVKLFEEREKEMKKEISEVAKMLKRNENNAKKIFDKLNYVIKNLEKYNISINANYLIAEFVNLYPDIASEIAELILSNPSEKLSENFSPFLWQLNQKSKYKKKVKELLRKGIETKNLWIIRNISRAYAWGGLLEEYDEEDIENIRFLLTYDDIAVKNSLFHAISILGQKDSKKAKELVLSIDINTDSQLANELCSIFDSRHGIPPEKLTKEEIKTILKKLVPIKVFSGSQYYIDKFLGYVSQVHLDLSIGFLIDRLKYYLEKDKKIEDYTPLPYEGFRQAFNGTSKVSGYEKYIREIRNLVLDERMNDPFWLPNLFKIVSDRYCDKALRILSEWIQENDNKKIEGIARLISDAPDYFLFSRYEFIGKLLESAEKVSIDCLKNVESDLFSIAIQGTRTGSLGEPSDKVVKLKNKGKEIADKFDDGHPGKKFYIKISEYGEAEIKRELERDEEFLDE